MSDKYTINEFASLLRKKAEGQYDDWDDKQLVNKFVKKYPDYADWISESLSGSEPQVQTVMIPHTPDVGIQPRTPSGPDLGFGKGPSGFTLGTGVGFTGDMDVMQRDSSLRNFSQMLTELEIPAETWEKLSEEEKERAQREYEKYKQSKSILSRAGDISTPDPGISMRTPTQMAHGGVSSSGLLPREGPGIRDIHRSQIIDESFNQRVRGSFTRAVDTELTEEQQNIINDLGDHLTLSELRIAEDVYSKIPEAEKRIKENERAWELVRGTGGQPAIRALEQLNAAKDELNALRSQLKIFDPEVKQELGFQRFQAIERGQERGDRVADFFRKVDERASTMREGGRIAPLVDAMPWDKATGIALEHVSELAKGLGRGALSQLSQNYYTGKALRERDPVKREYYFDKAHEFDEILAGLEASHPDVTKAFGSANDFTMWAAGAMGQLYPVVGSFILSSLAGGKVGGQLAAPFGPQAMAAGTVIGSGLGGFIAGYESYKSSIYWEIMKMGGTHDAARQLAMTYAAPASLFSIAVPSFLSSAALGAFGKRYVTNMMLARTRDMLLTTFSETTGEMLAQESVMYAREIGTGVVQTPEERANERWNTMFNAALIGPAGMMIPVQRRSSGQKPSAQEVDRHISLYYKINDYMHKPERPILKKFMVLQLESLDKQGLLGEEGRKILDHLIEAPLSDVDADATLQLMDKISIGVMERSDSENLARLVNLSIKDKTDVLDVNEALEVTSIIMNKPHVHDQYQATIIKESPSIQAYITQRKAMSDVEISRKTEPGTKDRIDAILRIEDAKDRKLALDALYENLTPEQIGAAKAYIQNTSAYNNMTQLSSQYADELLQQYTLDGQEAASQNTHTDGSVYFGELVNDDGSTQSVTILSTRDGADGGSYVVRDTNTSIKKVVPKAAVRGVQKTTPQAIIDAHLKKHSEIMEGMRQEKEGVSVVLSRLIRALTPGTKVNYKGTVGYVFGVLNGEMYMIPENGSISSDGIQVEINELSDVEILGPPTIESTEFVSQEVEVIDTPYYTITELENAYNQLFEDADVATVNVNKPVTKDGVELQPIPEGSRSGKPFDGWLYDTAKMFLDGTPEGAALIAQANRSKLSTFEREAMLEVLFGKGKVRLVEAAEAVPVTQQETQAVDEATETTPTGEYIAFDMSDKKPSSRDESNKISRSELNADIEGIANLVHYSSSELEVIDPSRFGAQSHTTERRRLGGVSFYYQGDARPESGVGNIAHIVRVNADLIYPLTKDPMNLIPKIEQKIKEYSKKNMGGLEIGVSPETLMEFSQEVLSELGFIGAYADWSYLDNMKRRVDGKRVELWKEQKVDRATTDSRRRFMVIRPSARDAMATMKHEIYNNIQQNLQRHPNKNEILPRFYSLEKQGVRALVNDEVISQYISKDLIEEYNRWAAVNDFVSVETSPLTNTQWAVISAWNPGDKRPGIAINRAQNEKLFSRLKEMGFEPVMQKGMYNTYEESIFVPGMTTEQAMEVGKEFGQESILSPEGLVYQDGSVNPGDISNIIFNQRANNHFSQIEIEGIPVKYQVPIDWDTVVPLDQAKQMTDQKRQQMRENLDQLDMSMDAANDYTGDQIKELIPDTKIVDIEGYPLMVEASIPVDGISADNVMNVPIGDSGGNINVFLNIINPVFNDPSLTHISFKELSDRIGREQAMEIFMAVEEAIYESEAWGEFVEEFGTLQHLLESQYSEQLHVDAATLFQDAYVLEVLKREGYDGVVFAGTNMEASTEYRVFDVSQIIDAQTGKPIDSGEGSFAIAGERGAQALDQISQATTRMDNLAVARSMETDGQSAKTIRLATGWEKGADGKWRYEIGDAKLKATFSDLRKQSWDSRRMVTTTLGEIVSATELFQAYPWLKDMVVEIDEHRGASAQYNPVEKTIYINNVESTESISLLMHEIQHAIQSHEGFAPGGSPETLFGFIEKQLQVITDQITFTEKNVEKYGWEKWEEVSGDTRDDLSSAKDLQSRLADASVKGFVEGEFKTYQSLAGEVEARNAQARMMMTPEERINTLLRDTEDIARGDQLIMMDMLGKPENPISHESIISMLFKNNLNARTAAEVLGQKHKDIQDAIEGIQSYENKRRTGINMDKVTDEMVIRVADYVGPIVFESIRGDMKNAIGWYSFDIEVAMEAASEIFPEIKTDKKAELVYKILLAITSPAATPYNNANLANSIMRYWLDNGKFPKANTKGVKFGVRVNTVVPNLVKISELFDKMSVDQAWEFLKNEQTREQFAEYGYTFTSPPYGAGTPVPGGAIFGAKVGGEFLASFLGNTNWGTMDMWMSRFIQMFLGQNPKGAASRGTKTTNLQGLRVRIREQKDPWTIPAPLDPSIVMTVRKPKGINTKSDILKNNTNLLAYAEAVDNAYAKTEDSKGNKHPKEFRDGSVIPGVLDSKGKEVTGSLVEISRRVKSNHNPGETPQNKGRQILQRAFQIIRERGKGMGYDLTAPDIQAILWYFTKDALEQAGYKPEPADTYSNALIEILKRNDNPKWEQYQIMKDKALAEKLKQSVKTPEGVSYFDMLSKAAQVKTDKDVTMGRIHSELVLLNMLSNEGGKVVIARNSQELMNAMAEQGETATSINDVAAKSPVLYINGMFSERTGVTYYNLEDMYLTGRSPLGIFLHEQGVHAGLKKLIPDQLKRNAFLTKLFNDLGGDSFMAQVFPSQRVYKEYRKNLPDHAVAEEYLARIAEKISADQILSQTERNAWQRFVDSIVDFIEKVLNRQVRITPKGAEAVALAAARTIIGEGAPARSQRISELGDILTPPDKMTVINPAGMKDGGKFSDGMIMMDIADKKPSSDQQGKNPLQIIEELQEQLKAARMEKGVTALKTIAKEKGKQAARRTIVEDFIRENRKMLQAINPGRIPSSLNKVLKAARSDKSLDGAIAGLKAAILEGQKTQARRMADDFARKLGRLKTETKSGGIMKAKLLLQEGVDYVESVRGILAMTKEEVSDAMIQIEKTIEGYEEVLSNREGDLEVMELLSNAEAMYNLLDMYGDLRNKPLDQVINAIEAMNVDMQDMKEKFKASRDAERVRRMEMIDGVAQDVGGDPTISDSYFTDIVKQSERTGPGWTQRYQAMHGTIASLSHAIWRGYKQGQRSKEFFNSKLFRLYKDVDNAISAKISMQEQMKAHLNEMMQDITLMKQKEFAKYMEEEHVVTLEVKTKDMAEDSYREKKISLKLGNLLHIWLSYQSEANKGYMDRVQMGDVKLRITERTFQEISKILDSSVDHRLITDFAIWLMTDYFGSNEYYNAVNEVVTRKIGRRLSSLQDYIPVIATSNRNTVDVDMSNFGIFKSIVKERRGGEYHLDKNNIWDVAIKYADDVSSMVHLAEPVSDFYYTLNSYPVRVATKAQETHHKVEAILDLLKKGYTGYTDKYAFLYETLLRRFRGSKILMNYSLLPKQITSLVAALDPDFGNPSGIATEMMAFLSGQGDKEIRSIVMEIAKAHADVRYRNMMDIESLTQKKERAMPKVNIRMFGEKPANMAMGVVATFLWNPTVVGDLVPVYVGGIPIAVHNYKAGLKMAESMGLKGDDAKNFAAQRAMDMMTEFINTTQQSSKWTHRAQFQYGGYRVMTSFMNALMGYSRKTTRHARDIGRDYKAAVARYIDEGADADTASMRALADIPPSKLAALFTYTTVLPLFFSAVGHWGMNWFRMFSEDDEERRRSRWQMVYDAFIAWTKGMFGIGFVLELGFNKSQDINYGPKMDNVIPILDDVMDIADGLRRIIKVMRDNNDELIKTKSEYEQRLYSAIKDTVNPLQGVLAGGSMVMVDRIFDVIMNEGYGDLAKAVARIYGISERDMQWFFDGDPLSQIDPDVAEFYDESDEFNSYQVGKYLSEMRARHEMVGTPFDERMYLNKFLAHRQIDAVNDPDARLTLNVLLSGWGTRKKAEWFANRYERYSDVISFRNEMISPFDHSYIEWASNTNPEKESALPPIMSAGLKDQIAERIALNISRSKLDTEEKIKQIDSLKSLDLSENQILRLNERIKSLQE